MKSVSINLNPVEQIPNFLSRWVGGGLILGLLIISPGLLAEDWENEIAFRSTITLSDFEFLQEMDTSPDALESYLNSVNVEWTYLEFRVVEELVGQKTREGKYSEAQEIWRKYKPKFPGQSARIDQVIKILGEDDKKIDIRNLGKELNSSADEYIPVVELLGNRIYFTAKDRKGGSGGEDIWYSDRDPGTGKWQEAKPLSELNSPNNESAESISPDGTTLTLFGNYQGGLGSGDLFISRLTESGWTLAEAFPSPINTEYFEADMVYSPTGKAVIFASDRPLSPFEFRRKNEFRYGDYWGNTDLYVSFLQDDGSFSEPKNLGKVINTPFAERTPYLHVDGKTLYFSSNGHPGLGDLDIFKSVRLDDTWENWSEPVHVGRILNSSAPDWGFRLASSGKVGYFSGRTLGGFGEGDLYEILPLPKFAEPASFAISLTGRVSDESGKSVSAMITWGEGKSDTGSGSLFSKPTSGEYNVSLPSGKEYNLRFFKEGYEPVSLRINTEQFREYEQIRKNIVLRDKNAGKIRTNPDSSGELFVPEEVYFSQRSDRIPEPSLENLKAVAVYLKKNPKLKVILMGYAKEFDSKLSDLEWSARRADSIRRFLLVQGITEDRIVSLGYGDTPSRTEKLESNRAVRFHRKVVIRFE